MSPKRMHNAPAVKSYGHDDGTGEVSNTSFPEVEATQDAGQGYDLKHSQAEAAQADEEFAKESP